MVAPSQKSKPSDAPRPKRRYNATNCHHHTRWEPGPEDRTKAETLAGWGVPQDMIALIIGIDPKTLRDRLHPELKMGEAKATAAVAQTLFNRATKGNDLAAAIFWLKARAGWREKQPDGDGEKGVTIQIRGGLPDAD